MTFGERIKLLRESRGLSQETLGNALGVPRSTVAHYETPTPLNQRFPRIERLMDLAKYFKVSIDYLVGMQENDDVIDERSEEKKLSKPKLVSPTNELIDALTVQSQLLRENNRLLELNCNAYKAIITIKGG